MRLNKNKSSVNRTLRVGLFISSVFFSGQLLQAQNATDDQNVTLPACEKKITVPQYCIQESNVVFPDILKGEEENTLEYIEKFSSRKREYLQRMYSKGKTLLPKAADILKQYDLPEELRVLMTLESAYDANAVSSAGAVGYWQFMDAVAREYGLKCSKRFTASEKRRIIKEKGRKAKAYMRALARQKDERKNFLKSTIAAARYLRDRRLNLDDNWLLVVASYNCGVGNVWNAMERSGKSNPTFWDVKKYLPAETQSYVMNFITLNVIFSNYENFVKNKLVFSPVKLMLAKDEGTDFNETEAQPTATAAALK